MPDYFENCKNYDDARAIYWELAKQFHPDKGGKTADFQELQNQFENFKPREEKFKGEADQWKAKEYANIIEQLLKIDSSILIEICGSWIWLSGNTKPHKESIKAIETGESYKRVWHRKKEMWYFSPKNYYRGKGNGTDYSMDWIRGEYGSNTVTGSNRQEENKPAQITH